MATILIHPTLACSPCQAEAFQARHGLLMVISGNVVKAIPALHYRTPPQRQHAQRTDWTGGDAA